MKPEASTGRWSRMAYRAFTACSLVTTATAVAFFFIGIGDGSVSSFNMGLWLLLLSVLGCVLWSGHALRARGHMASAIAVLAIAAVPGVLGGLFILLLLVTQPRWN